jgi:hypothetical protein
VYNKNIGQTRGAAYMGYRIINVTPEFRAQWEPRVGLEGPFFYEGNRVLYYDAREGKYLNPQTDMYLTYEEYDEIAKQ